MQNDTNTAPQLTADTFARMVRDLGIPAPAADLDAARPAAEALLRQARDVETRP